MLAELLLTLALTVGQTDDATAAPAPDAIPAVVVSTSPPAPAPDRWLLMKSLQGTYQGWLLDGNRIQVYGWTDFSFTTSTASEQNLPSGLNYRANELLMQQNWLRIDRPVITSGTTEPTFGFRSD